MEWQMVYPLGRFSNRKDYCLVPEWNPDFVFTVGLLLFVCPHAAIRLLVKDDELNLAQKDIRWDFKGKATLNVTYSQVSVEDCTDANYVKSPSSQGKVLKTHQWLQNEATLKEQAINWAFSMITSKRNPGKPGTIAYTQFEQPLLEFSECRLWRDSHAKLLTPDVWGSSAGSVNATGCHSARRHSYNQQNGCGLLGEILIRRQCWIYYGMLTVQIPDVNPWSK